MLLHGCVHCYQVGDIRRLFHHFYWIEQKKTIGFLQNVAMEECDSSAAVSFGNRITVARIKRHSGIGKK